jgi:hypothetical protein
MPDILIDGGNAEEAAAAMRTALREIFDVEPTRSVRGGAEPPGTRTLGEIGLIVLAFPPAAIYGKKMIAEFGLGELCRRLIGRAVTVEKATHARILLDPGDGTKPVPLHEAHPDKLREALDALKAQHKSA